MVNINCLLNNTELVKKMRDIIEYIGYDRAAREKDVSLNSIYKEVRKAGVEIDLRSVGELYADALPLHDERFTPRHEIDQIVGRDFENSVRNIMLMKPKEGEEKIGSESPEQHVANRIANTFYGDIVQNEKTKSTMKEMQDAMFKAAQRLLGERPSEPKTKEHFTDTIDRALEREEKGFPTLDGKLNSIKDLFDATREEVKKYSENIKGTDNDVLRAQWEDYVKSFEDATYSTLFSKDEARNVLNESMKEAGFGKDLKNGKTIIDWDKLTGGINDIHQLRENVRKVLEDKGYSPEIASRTADALQKEYHEMRGRILERSQNKFDNIQSKWGAAKQQNTKVTVDDIIDKRVKEVENFRKLSGNAQDIVFTPEEARKIIVDALKKQGFGKESGDNVILDWKRMSGDIKSSQQLRDAVVKELRDKGMDFLHAHEVAGAMKNMYDTIQQEILARAHTELDKMQANIGKDRTAQKSDLTRLAELNDLGIFNNTHDAVLHNLLGIDDATTQDMARLQDIAQMVGDLSKEVGGKDYLAAPLFQSFQRDVNEIVARNVNNRNGLLKAMSVIHHYFQLANMGIIGNVFNMFENNLSGLKEMFSSNLNALHEMGMENAFKDKKLLTSVWRDVAAGGVEYGEDPQRFSNTSNITDKLKLRDAKFDIRDPKGFARDMARVVIAPAKAWLNGSDGAYKAVLHKKSMLLALHHALTEQGVGKEEAAHILNESLYGTSLEDARKQASDMLDRYNQPNTPQAVERLANNLVIQNLNNDGRMNDDVVEAAYKSSYKVAGLGLGHEANNMVSRILHSAKMSAKLKEAQLIKEEKYGDLAYHRFMNTIAFSGVLRFLSGASNWAILRIQSGLGVGIASGLLGKFKGADELDFENKDKLQESMEDYLNANRKITRGMVGLGYFALYAAAMYGYGMTQMNKKKKDDDEGPESALDAAFHSIAGNYAGNRLMNKIGPDILLLQYMASKKGDNKLAGTVDYVQNTFNVGTRYSLGGQIMEIANNLAPNRGRKGEMKAVGEAWNIPGGMMEVPFYRSYKNAFQLINYAVTGNAMKPQYKQPMTALQGLMGGGMMEDLGLFKRNAPVEVLPGVSNKVAEQMNADGIKSVSDLKNHPDWPQYLDARNSKKAVDIYNDVYGGKQPVEKDE